MLHYDPFSYADLGLSPYISSPYGAIQGFQDFLNFIFNFGFLVGKWNVVGGMPNVTQFPPMWYEFADRPDLHDFVKDIVELDEHWGADPLMKV